MNHPKHAPPSGADQADSNEGMYQAMMSRALRHYWYNLNNSMKARRYLKERGIDFQSIRRYGLGFAEPASQSLKTVFPNYHVSALVEVGLVIDSDDGKRRYDRFRDRIMFPILSDTGRVIAFGGRLIEGEGPKYLNSPQTTLFDKGATLFGWPQARCSIEREQEVVVMEGYMDVVMSAQHGVENVVATLGTATTATHVRKLMGLPVKRVVFCFDGDSAGRKAAGAAMEACMEVVNATSAQVAFAFLPDDHDPDSFVREHGAEAFKGFLAKAITFEQFLLETLRNGKDLSTCEGRAHMTHEALAALARIQDAAMYYRLCEVVASDAQLSVGEVIELTGNAGQRTWFPAQANEGKTDQVVKGSRSVA